MLMVNQRGGSGAFEPAPQPCWRPIQSILFSRLSTFLAWFALGSMLPVGVVQAAPVDEVRADLARLNAWLGTGPAAAAWTDYLQLPELQAELAAGAQADFIPVARTASRLETTQPGLNQPYFQDLRRSLENWLEQLPPPPAGQLPEIARQAAEEVRPISEAEVRGARQQLAAAVARLDRYLAGIGRSGPDWRRYLLWDELTAALNQPTPDPEQLRAVLARFRRNEPGLERSAFQELARALEVYLDLQEAALNPQFQEQLQAELETLAQALEQLAQGQNGGAAEAVGARIGYLDRIGRAGALVEAIRRVYSRPNLFVAASEPIVAAGLEQPAPDVVPIRDVILGTQIYGTGLTTAQLSLRFWPNPNVAWIELVANGQINSRSTGYNGPVTIQSTAITNFQSRKVIELAPEGFTAGCATAAAMNNSCILDIEAGGRLLSHLIERIAAKRAAQQKPLAEQIAAEHAEARIQTQFDQETAQRLAQANFQYQQEFLQPLARENALPQNLRFSTTAERLFATASQAGENQIAVATRPPAPLPPGADLGVLVHGTLFNNYAQSLLGGETLTEAEVRAGILERFGSLPPRMQQRGEAPPWQITFTEEQPITVDIDANNLVTVTIRAVEFRGGENVLRPMRISAQYRIVDAGEGIRAIRQGDIQVVPLDFEPGEGRRLTTEQAAQAGALRRRFEELFEPVLEWGPLVLPGDFRQAGELAATVVDTAPGWLRLAWNRTGRPAPPPTPQTPTPVALAR